MFFYWVAYRVEESQSGVVMGVAFLKSTLDSFNKNEISKEKLTLRSQKPSVEYSFDSRRLFLRIYPDK